MITCFTDPYPDELLYSVCARYRHLMRYPNYQRATCDLFGRAVKAPLEFSTRIGHLTSSLPPNHKYTADEFIDNHTLFPFYAQFLPTERAQLIRKDMYGNGENRAISRMGLTINRSYWPEWLRFCPNCVVEDRNQYGEAYWHRVHQLQGIEVCPDHSVFLEASKIAWRNRRNPVAVFSAEDSVFDTPVRVINTYDHIHNIQLKIALCAKWLLQWHGAPLGTHTLIKRYYYLLLEQGYASYSGSFRSKKLTETFENYFTPIFLRRLGCAFPTIKQHSWLIRLLMVCNAKVMHLPIRHILLLIFLDQTPDSFFTAFRENKPFGDGPWPCLNPASDHYKQPQVRACRVDDGNRDLSGRPRGTFSCDCGFIYTRPGPDKAEEDRFKYSSVQTYGGIWNQTLREMWNASITITAIASKLGVDKLTVIRRAIKLGLKYPRKVSFSKPKSKRTLHRRKLIKGPLPEERLPIQRQKLLDLLKAHPQASRKELNRLSYSLLFWLRRNDRGWLEDHLPPCKRKICEYKTVDYEKRDCDTVDKVKRAAISIREIKGRPVRVSKTAIIDQIGPRSKVEWSLINLPLTKKALKECVEPFEDFLLRRIEWATKCYRNERIAPSLTMFLRRTGTKSWIVKSERVRKAVDDAMASLNHGYC